ncbi:MAG: calcium/sodium antiporter [Rikenellaceae bacterium]|nr:calcium/sodium antiporter [Rikenellaceae bacterium]
MNILLLLTGLLLILAGANFLTDGSASLAQRFRVPEFIIGLTIVAMGTSAPELVVSLLSAIDGASDIAIGNVVGSNLFNTLLILGVTALLRPIPLSRNNIRRDIPMGAAVSLLLMFMLCDRWITGAPAERISRAEGAVLLLLFALFMWHSLRDAARPGTPHAAGTPPAETASAPAKPIPVWLTVVMIAGGLAGLIFGGRLFLQSATALARSLGVSESVIAITLVAGGTSLPELAASVVSAVKGRTGLALGNVVGSNIFNILFILGVSSLVSPLTPGSVSFYDTAMVTVSALLLLATAFTFRRKEIDRIEGVLFLLIYVVYIVRLVLR